MPREIDSGALTALNRSLNLAGSSGSSTQLLDEAVHQVLDVTTIVRRSLTLAGTSGITWGVLQNDHGAGASGLSTTINPYSPTTADLRSSFPANLPIQFEIWLLGASLVLASGTGSNLTEMTLSQSIVPTNTAFGIDDSGDSPSVFSGAFGVPLARWDTMDTTLGSGSTATMALQENGTPFAKIGLRLRRGISLVFRSGSTGAASVACVLSLGVFPIATGQDVIS